VGKKRRRRLATRGAVQTGLEEASLGSTIRLVIAGFGVAIGSHLTIQAELMSGQLVILPVRDFQLTQLDFDPRSARNVLVDRLDI
jgi:DNA-binding transcriptional LysR family regulator